MKVSRAYIAAPIFTPEQLRVVEGIKAVIKHQLGLEVFSPWHASRATWNGRSPAEAGEAARRAVLRGNIVNLHWADLVVAWLGGTEDGRTDTGVVYEMGYAGALSQVPSIDGASGRRRPYVLGYIDPTDKRKGQDINLMLAGTLDAVVEGEGSLLNAVRLLREGEAHAVSMQYSVESLVSHEAEPVARVMPTPHELFTYREQNEKLEFNGFLLSETMVWDEMPDDVKASPELKGVLEHAKGRLIGRSELNRIVALVRQIEAGTITLEEGAGFFA